MNDAQIKHMVERFLQWRLPDNFNPDGGITFKAEYGEGGPYPGRHSPIGTNLLTSTQAEAMVRHIVEGMPITRISSDEGDWGRIEWLKLLADGKSVKVLLNGVEQKNCVVADEMGGYVVRAVETDRGNLVLCGDSIMREVVCGNVEIVITEEKEQT